MATGSCWDTGDTWLGSESRVALRPPLPVNLVTFAVLIDVRALAWCRRCRGAFCAFPVVIVVADDGDGRSFRRMVFRPRVSLDFRPPSLRFHGTEPLHRACKDVSVMMGRAQKCANAAR